MQQRGQVRLDDIARLGAALDTLVGAGANQMNGIGFDIATPAPLLEKARAQAIADARATGRDLCPGSRA